MRRIDTEEDIAAGLEALAGIDPCLRAVIAEAGPVPLRRRPPGFDSLVSIVIAQQVSTASAAAIEGRLRALVDPLDARGVLDAGEDIFRAAGLSRPKQAAILAIAEEVDGELDLHGLCDLPHDAAIERLTAVRGIGPWTAEVYLLFCAGHPDMFPARDVALQSAVGDAFSMAARPGEKDLAAMAESWAPWRGVAARLFWAYYRAKRGRDAAPVQIEAKNV